MVIKPKVRGFVCVTAHPTGCAANVREQIDYVKAQPPVKDGPKKVLVVGASTGYGLASRVAAAFGCGAGTLGVFFERPSMKGKPASPGWYNSVAVEEAAKAEGKYARSVNGDAFSDEIKQEVVDIIKQDLGQVDLVVYSLASPRRTHPKTGETHKSVLKPIGGTFTGKNLNTDKKIVNEVTIEPASEEEVEETRQVMGGEDWELWMETLDAAGVLAPGCDSVAYSYIGPEVTWPIYKNGTIGRAKEDLQESAKRVHGRLSKTGGRGLVSVNKAVVTQASSAIPVVPLYVSILFKVMKEKGTHEGCIEQIQRLFATQLYNGNTPRLDEEGRVRVDDWEMDPEVQAAVKEVWKDVDSDNIDEVSDFAGYQREFLKLFGFEVDGVDYSEDVDLEVNFPG